MPPLDPRDKLIAISRTLADFSKMVNEAAGSDPVPLDALLSEHAKLQRQLSTTFGLVATSLLKDRGMLDQARDAVRSRMVQLFDARVPASYLVVPLYGASQRKILEFLAQNVGHGVSGSRLRVLNNDQVHTERRLRELRDLGFGIDAKGKGGSTVYTLASMQADLDHAARFALEHAIKADRDINATEKMFLLLKAELGRPVNTKRLQRLSGNQSQYDRRIREIRERYSISTGLNRAGIGPNDYLLESLNEKDRADQFSSKTVAAIFKRDKYRCGDCGWSKDDPPQGGRRYLEAHHKTHRAQGGESTVENGITLCNVCHAARHAKIASAK